MAKTNKVPQLEKVMEMHLEVSLPQIVASNIQIFDVPGGKVEGFGEASGMKGKVVAPSGDWVRDDSAGILMHDVRMSIEADDGSMIFCAYQGRIVPTAEAGEKMASGGLVGGEELYFTTAPLFRTESEKYGWLKQRVFIGCMQSLRAATEKSLGTLHYDIYKVL